jgi:hypothetical protein
VQIIDDEGMGVAAATRTSEMGIIAGQIIMTMGEMTDCQTRAATVTAAKVSSAKNPKVKRWVRTSSSSAPTERSKRLSDVRSERAEVSLAVRGPVA